MRNKKYPFLAKPFIIMNGVNSSFGFVEKWDGKRDAQENQVCDYRDGHITPNIDSKVNSYYSHMNKIYLKTTQVFEPMVEEANSLAIELKLLMKFKFSFIDGKGEEAQRQAARAASKSAETEKRKSEILIRLAAIRAESDMANEMLLHYIERSKGILHSRISKYWRGVLASSTGGLEHFPILDQKESPAKEEYEYNRKKLVDMIDSLMNYGGDIYVEKENEKACCG